MTVINPNSISGITSITMPSGDGNVLTIHTNDGTERFRIDSSGNVKVGSACTISQDGDVFFTGVTTATTFAGAHSGSGANLTSLPAAQLTGSLPAISGANLTGIAATDNVRTGILDVAGVSTFRNTMNVGAAVTISESGIEASGIGITVANINGTQIGGRRNLIINGAMNVAQRGTSSTSNGFYSVDRFGIYFTGVDENPTQAQVDVASGTGPYTSGLRKALKITNGNQTGGAGAGDYIYISYKIESQDMAQSGWNYTSTSSFITLSFWVKSSVAQTFYGYLKTPDGTGQGYRFETGSLSADTWTKVIVTAPGDSDIQFDTDSTANSIAMGMELVIAPWFGTNYTAQTSDTPLGEWFDYSSGATRMRDMTSTWYTTNDATFEITGVQLEVGSQATSFEHRSAGDELALCQRYYYIFADGREDSQMATGFAYHSNQPEITLNYPVMRGSPSLVHPSGTNYYGVKNNNANVTFDDWLWYQATPRCGLLYRGSGMGSSLTAGQAYRFYFNSDQAYIHLSAEL